MKSIPIQPFPLDGDVLLSDLKATRAWRRMFYDVLTVEAKGVLEALGAECRPALSQIDYMQLVFAPEALWPEIMVPVRPFVQAWANRHNLNVDWLIHDTLMALTDPDVKNGALPLLTPHALPQANDPPPAASGFVPFGFAWHYETQPRWAFRKLMIDSFSKRLDAELDRIERQAAVGGFSKHEAKRQRAGADAARHFRWLVRYQVLKEGYTDIRKSEGKALETVRAAVRETVDRIGLPPRPSDPPGTRPGPRKSSR